MTSQLLAAELTTLIQDSKRKLPELRNAAEKSLQDLKALPSTSEAQLAADLSKRPHFIEPFVIACSSRNSKYATSGISCLQRLAVSRALPKNRLKDVLEAVKECSTFGGLEIQLKILQTLPSLLQNYPEDVKGGLLFTALQTCSSLQTSKTPSVGGTAAATLQQLVTSLFESLVVEDKRALELPTVTEVTGDGKQIAVRAVAFDAYRVFHDLCVLTEGVKPQYIRFSAMPEVICLELIETIMINHAESFAAHPELAHVLRKNLLPYLLRVFAEKSPFPIALRSTRLLYLIIREHVEIFPSEVGTALDSLAHTIESDTVPNWKRVLSMEVLRGILSESSLVLQIQSKFDGQNGTKPILSNCLGVFVRLASEKPALIGLSQQSTVPVGNYFQRDSTGEAGHDPATSGGLGTAGVGTAAVPGISNQWSSVRAPCIDQLDKSEPPSLPETYIYSLVLACLNNFSESLARFILPLSVHGSAKGKKKGKDEANPDEPAASVHHTGQKRIKRSNSYQKRTVPKNPLVLESHPMHKDIQTVATLIDQCWPAVLASCSTFFYAALDNDHYRALVRTFQKFTHVAGLLRMSTPRDAFLTTLGKAAVPSHLLAASFTSPTLQSAQSPGILGNAKGLLNVESLVSQASTLLPDRNRRNSIDSGETTLSSRNLLCLRALLNLAIALGPTLDTSWNIVFETLQQADKVMSASGARTTTPREIRPSLQTPTQSSTDVSFQQIMGSEVTAIQAAASRLFESTVDFPNEAFVCVLEALCRIMDGKQVPATSAGPESPPIGHKRRVASFSGISIRTEMNDQDFTFALSKIRELVTLNLDRFIHHGTAESGWDLFMDRVTAIAVHYDVPTNARLLGAELVSRLTQDTISATIAEDFEPKDEVQARSLLALLKLCNGLVALPANPADNFGDGMSVEVHNIALDSLRTILERVGDSLTSAWDTVFDIISTAFITKSKTGDAYSNGQTNRAAVLSSVQLGRSAFNSLQLICSDFLVSVPDSSLLSLIDILYRFCSQEQDLNISLTTMTFFWNLSDFLYARNPTESLEDYANELESDASSGDEDLMRRLITASAEQKSMPALWMLLLRRLTDVVADSREEVRCGAVHTTLRIFDHGDDLSPKTWQVFLNVILLRMLRMDFMSYETILAEQSDDLPATLNGKISTSCIILEGFGQLFASYFPAISRCPDFLELWQSLTDTLAAYLRLKLHALNAAVFTMITAVLSKIPDINAVPEEAVQAIFNNWVNNFPEADPNIKAKSNQAAFEAYAGSFLEIYRLGGPKIETEDVRKIADNLERCIKESEGSAYSSDVDSLTAVQSKVIQCLSTIRTDPSGTPPILISLLACLIKLPLADIHAKRESGRLTFVALSKSAMELAQSLVTDHIQNDEIFTEALLSLIQSLELPIKLKYAITLQGRPPTLWQKATTTLLSVLSSATPRIFSVNLPQPALHAYWTTIVQTGAGISRADLTSSPPSTIHEDETFDLTSLKQLNALIIPALGSTSIPDATRRAYTQALFHSSLIHESCTPDPAAPLADLYAIRLGRTAPAPPTPRVRMAYLCLSLLIELVSVHDGSGARVRLAQAAAPWLILRAALPLKVYIADQPLRGRYMPQPESERRELLFVLEKVGGMECEPKAIPEAEGLRSKGRKGLVRLYPLLWQAVRIGGCKEVVEALAGCLERVGDEFGL
ncbi:endosomal peripheral membrane protein-like protein [Trichodelitschia bisporula]|uniref:Endosomal peripheral membrane protein-like protein n=1 Tax=Trichodelitschia bisporula TaxID=703511 RepID=A0A6G1HZ25_9PEZI|nr:endosomal peripheral membrane protein-like protein [Trichodelitschia bisporula]